MTITDPHPDQGLPVAPPSIAFALSALAECVCEALTLEGQGPTCWCGLYPGASVSWDYCGVECSNEVCGMGYVRFAGAFPYSAFPIPVIDERCSLPLAWQVEVGAMRCMPVLPDGELLGPVEMGEVALGQMFDARALYNAIKCCGLELAVQQYVPVGPAGGCVGGFWTAYALVD